MRSIGITLVLLGIVLLGEPASMIAAPRAPHLDALRRLHADLILDGPLDRTKLDRLLDVALANDLVIDSEERALLESYVASGYVDPTGDSAPLIEATFGGAPLTGWLARCRTLLVTTLRAGVTTRRGGQALRELTAIAWRDDLTAEDRQRMPILVDHVRQIDTKQVSRDALVGLSVLIANPEGARLDREHERQLEILAKLSNQPTVVWPPGLGLSKDASGSPRLR